MLGRILKIFALVVFFCKKYATNYNYEEVEGRGIHFQSFSRPKPKSLMA